MSVIDDLSLVLMVTIAAAVLWYEAKLWLRGSRFRREVQPHQRLDRDTESSEPVARR